MLKLFSCCGFVGVSDLKWPRCIVHAIRWRSANTIGEEILCAMLGQFDTVLCVVAPLDFGAATINVPARFRQPPILYICFQNWPRYFSLGPSQITRLTLFCFVSFFCLFFSRSLRLFRYFKYHWELCSCTIGISHAFFIIPSHLPVFAMVFVNRRGKYILSGRWLTSTKKKTSIYKRFFFWLLLNVDCCKNRNFYYDF